MTFLTIVVAVGIYLFRNNGETFKNFSKEKILEFGYQKLEENLAIVKNEKFKDSIKILLKKQIHSLNKENFDEAMNEFGNTADKIKDIIRDKKIDSLEYNELKKMVLHNERSKKNRN